jgi:hypothetical protein
MTDNSVKASLDLKTRLNGTSSSKNGGFDSLEKFKDFLSGERTSKDKVKAALSTLHASVDAEQADKDVADFFGKETDVSDSENDVSINITISGAGKIKVN